MTQSDVAIIGAGPCGLMAAFVLAEQGIDVAVFEAGDEFSVRGALGGIGGAGLYSDGKFSFAPAGTHVWQLQPLDLLIKSYEAVSTALHNVTAEPIPAFSGEEQTTGQFKSYPSIRLSFESRQNLVYHLMEKAAPAPVHRVMRISPGKDGVFLQVHSDRGPEMHQSRAIVLATGRLWNDHLTYPLPTVFRRLEVGVRLEQPATDFIFRSAPELDPKWRVEIPEPLREYRTFCCCRNGRVLPVETRHGTLMSGTTDPPRTDSSNIGVTVRYLEGDFAALPPRPHVRFSVPYEMARANSLAFQSIMGPSASHVLEALGLLSQSVRQELRNAVLHGPCLEGVSEYPDIDATNLKVPNWPIWVGGDATGLFRGLVPAMVSGAYIGHRIRSYFEIRKGIR